MSTSIGGTPLADLPYVHYSADLEREEDNEAEMIERVVAALRRNNEWQYARRKHAIRDAHAKGHGALIGRLVVGDGLRRTCVRACSPHPASIRLSRASRAPRGRSAATGSKKCGR